MKITVYFDPKDVKPTVVQNATVVLADVLRATTTIPVFLYHGAAGVALCPDPGTAKKIFEKQKRGEGLLAGERDWQKIPGFHLGGSPNDSSRGRSIRATRRVILPSCTGSALPNLNQRSSILAHCPPRCPGSSAMCKPASGLPSIGFGRSPGGLQQCFGCRRSKSSLAKWRRK